MARSRPRPDSAQHVTDAVAQFARSLAADARVCVALSGGIDSVTLLHALATLGNSAAVEDKWLLSAHHVHHGLSAFADQWQSHCETLCTSLDIPLTAERVQVDRNAPEGIEAAARSARYASLAQVDADAVVLAHHQRDQAETVLLQLLRGAGPAGLAAMPTDSQSDRYQRPLLAVSKAAIESYAREHQLKWVEDDSNGDSRFARNRLRNEVWPILASAFPSAETALSRAAAHQADAAELQRDLATLDACDAIHPDTQALNLARLAMLSPARRANLLRHWLETNAMEIPPTETLHEWLRQLLAPAVKQAVQLRRGASDQRSIRVYRGAAYIANDPVFWQQRAWNGETYVQLDVPNASRLQALAAVRFTASNEPSAIRRPATGERWLLRPRREGDAIRLSAKSGSVSLKNVMQSSGIPPWLRDVWPLLVCNNDVVAVASVATANAYTVRSGETGWRCEWKPAWGVPSRP